MHQLEITDGPSKFDLMLALFDGNCEHRREVVFNLRAGKSTSTLAVIDSVVVIDSVTREDGSGESWNFEGRVVDFVGNPKIIGYFSTRTRKGWVRF